MAAGGGGGMPPGMGMPDMGNGGGGGGMPNMGGGGGGMPDMATMVRCRVAALLKRSNGGALSA